MHHLQILDTGFITPISTNLMIYMSNLPNIKSINISSSISGSRESSEDVEERGLASAIVAQHSCDLAFVDAQVDVVNGLDFRLATMSEAFLEAYDPNGFFVLKLPVEKQENAYFGISN